ncbi:MAG: hypothetical protein CMH79_00565 [Nitrospinae bacterium]|nr:hypothetical protein [Nitrospinota bacterium]
MRKFLLTLAVAVLAVGLVLPEVFAASFKFTGMYRYRGVSYDDADRDNTTEDGNQKADMLMRPRFTAVSEGGKVKAVWELDLGSGAWDVTKTAPKVNRHYVQFALPGTKLKVQYGRDDYFSPGKTLVTSSGLNRTQGWEVTGKMAGMKMTAWTVKVAEGGAGGSGGPFGGKNDADVHHIGITTKAAGLTLTPHLTIEADGRGSGTATPDKDIRWWGLNAKGKVGMFSLKVDAIYQEGTIDYPSSSATVKDIDIKASMLQVSATTKVGKSKVELRAFATSGDKDGLAASQSHGLTAQQDGNNELTRFSGPKADAMMWTNNPQIISRKRYSTFNISAGNETRSGNGNGGTNGNGLRVMEIIVSHPISKKLSFKGNLSSIHSSESAQDISGGTQYVSDTNIGTEVDASLKYKFYKSLWAQVTYAYLSVGDYGKSTGATKDLDNTWCWYFEIRHSF